MVRGLAGALLWTAGPARGNCEFGDIRNVGVVAKW